MSRRLSREIAFKVLFQVDVGKCTSRTALLHSMEGFKLTDQEQQFVQEVIDGTLANLGDIDQIIKNHLINWKLERLPAVNRNLLRLALYEIIYRTDIPLAVSINEALELARKYGSSEEGVAFINSVLDRASGQNVQGGD
ncbi:MAG TPA: transcription antitermination factor NusB [Firmicutes bacterium]|nr:transcription antitermination factor NusB [Bacillota bacterium]